MDPRVNLGLKVLLQGKIVLLEGPGHPPILEALVSAWREATAEKITLTREGRTTDFYSAGGSCYVQDMIRFWQEDLFEAKQKLAESARDVSLLAISHLGIETPNQYRKEAVRLLILERVNRLSSPGSPPFCAILGTEAPGALRDRYGEDLARAVGDVGVSIETP